MSCNHWACSNFRLPCLVRSSYVWSGCVWSSYMWSGCIWSGRMCSAYMWSGCVCVVEQRVVWLCVVRICVVMSYCVRSGYRMRHHTTPHDMQCPLSATCPHRANRVWTRLCTGWVGRLLTGCLFLMNATKQRTSRPERRARAPRLPPMSLWVHVCGCVYERMSAYAHTRYEIWNACVFIQALTPMYAPSLTHMQTSYKYAQAEGTPWSNIALKSRYTKLPYSHSTLGCIVSCLRSY